MRVQVHGAKKPKAYCHMRVKSYASKVDLYVISVLLLFKYHTVLVLECHIYSIIRCTTIILILVFNYVILKKVKRIYFYF